MTLLLGTVQAVVGMRRAGIDAASDSDTAELELSALADAAAVFPKASCTLITLHQTGFPKLALPAKTRVVAAWLWLLVRRSQQELLNESFEIPLQFKSWG